MDNPQELLQCPYCDSKVKANRMSLHISRVHKNISGRQQCPLHTDHKAKDMDYHLDECEAMDELKKTVYDVGGISTVPEPPPCVVNFGDDVECWDSANFPTYDPLESTKNKNIIRGFYAAGLKPLEKKNVIKEERARRAQLSERENAGKMNRINYSRNNFNTLSEGSKMLSSNVAPTNGKRIPSNPGRFAEINSDSNVSSKSTLPYNKVNSTNMPLNEVLDNGSTTDSDGFIRVERRKPHSIPSRGRGRYNEK